MFSDYSFSISTADLGNDDVEVYLLATNMLSAPDTKNRSDVETSRAEIHDKLSGKMAENLQNHGLVLLNDEAFKFVSRNLVAVLREELQPTDGLRAIIRNRKILFGDTLPLPKDFDLDRKKYGF